MTLIALSLGDAYLELKSSPKHLTQGEVAAFFARVRRLRPDVAVFAMDTALRLSDRVLPLLVAELGSAAGGRGASSATCGRLRRTSMW